MTAERLDDEIARLYRRSRELWLVGRRDEALEIYRGLRRDHSVELYPEVELPSLIKFVHPLGTVLGRAAYAPGLVVYQGVSVGSTVDGDRPTFKGACVLFPGSGVIGPVTVGNNVWIAAGTIVEARPAGSITIPNNCVVHSAGRTAHDYLYTTTDTKRSVLETFFNN